MDTALVMGFLFFREVVIFGTSYKSHDVGKYRGCSLLHEKIVLT